MQIKSEMHLSNCCSLNFLNLQPVHKEQFPVQLPETRRSLINAQGAQGTRNLWHCRVAQAKTNIPARHLMHETNQVELNLKT